MYYPNTNQMSALTGRTIKPDYQSYIGEQVAALPQYLQLQEQRDYNNARLDLDERSFAENKRQSLLDYDLAKEQADAAKKQQLYGNLISGGGLALNAYQALDESGVDLSGGASRALNSVLPSTESVSEFAKAGDTMAYGNQAGVPGSSMMDYVTQGAKDWVVEPAEAVGEGAVNFVTKDMPELYDVGKKIFSGDGGWSDVQGWAENLFK